jgi:hypothetical protein
LAEEGSLLQDGAAESNIGEALDNLFGYGSTAGSSQGGCAELLCLNACSYRVDAPIVLESDSVLEDGDKNPNTHALRSLDTEQLGHDALDLDILSASFSHSADKLENSDSNSGDNSIDNNTLPHPAKRQRPASPRCEPNLHRISTPPLPQNGDMESSRKYTDSSDSDQSGDEILLSKRRKLSGSLGSSTDLSSYNGRSQKSALSISEDLEANRADGSESISVDENVVSTARTTPVVFESASLTKLQSCQVTDTNRYWEVRKIIGKEYVDGVLHYLVEWCPTLEPVYLLEHAKELVNEFEARLAALRMDKERRKEPGVKRDGQSVIAAGKPLRHPSDVSGGQEKKRRRGRPRKQK